MALKVKEIMNRELFSLHAGDSADDALADLLALHITGGPVVDGEGRPLGVVSLRDLARPRAGDTAGEVMTKPATVVHLEASIAEAGRLLAETGYHRLVAVAEDGRAVGLVSALDVVRGLLGIPTAHPASFPHLDPQTGLVWTDDWPLDLEHLEAAPDGPGLVVLTHGGAGRPERTVWAESCHNVFARLADIVSTPRTDHPGLAFWLDRGPLRFRVAPLTEHDWRRQPPAAPPRQRLPAAS
jgi:CBS domain-containing protein